MIMFECGVHVSSTFLIVFFHNKDLLDTKFCVVVLGSSFDRYI